MVQSFKPNIILFEKGSKYYYNNKDDPKHKDFDSKTRKNGVVAGRNGKLIKNLNRFLS